uniref:Uncharacterized protein n=1 Tax=Angiostrongylus cantonensis TaxID=6313 RepID=A0A0K0D4L9_ANGCA
MTSCLLLLACMIKWYIEDSDVQRCEQIYPAYAFTATRFGSTKFKTYKSLEGVYDGDRCHPFTIPSTLAYLRQAGDTLLFEFLNTIALAATIIERNIEDTGTQKAIEGFLKDEKKNVKMYGNFFFFFPSKIFLLSKIVGVETGEMNV